MAVSFSSRLFPWSEQGTLDQPVAADGALVTSGGRPSQWTGDQYGQRRRKSPSSWVKLHALRRPGGRAAELGTFASAAQRIPDQYRLPRTKPRLPPPPMATTLPGCEPNMDRLEFPFRRAHMETRTV